MDMLEGELYGYKRLEFDVPGTSSKGFVAMGTGDMKPANPWIWYAPTFINTGAYQLPKPLHEYYLSAALAEGVAVGGVDVGESWGSPKGREIYTQYYRFVVEHFGLSDKPCMMAQSRGGLMAYNWATEHPDCVGAIGAIYPVCDVTRYSKLSTIAEAYGLSPQQLMAERDAHDPITKVESLVKAGVPILHIHGLVDEMVPFESNSFALVDKYRRLGGHAGLIEVPDCGHEEVPEFFRNDRMAEFFRSAGRSVDI